MPSKLYDTGKQAADASTFDGIDNAGASWSNYQAAHEAIASDKLLLWQVTLTADAPGTLVFTSADSDSPFFPLVTFDPAAVVPAEAVIFGSDTITISGGTGPLAIDDTASTDEDAATVIDVLANDNAGAEAIDPTSVVITNDPANGTVEVDAATGAVTYTPDADYNGPDSFTYMVKDAQGTDSNEASVAITIADINDLPVAGDDSASGAEGTAIIIDVLSNDSDVDGTLDISSLAISTAPTSGSVEIDAATGVMTYTPDAAFFGNDSFGYTIADDDGGVSAEATVTIDVTEVATTVRITIEAFDALTLQPITSAAVGTEFILRASVQDVRTDSQIELGVFAAYIDLFYDASLVSIELDAADPSDFLAAITFGDNFGIAHNGVNEAGMIDNIGASNDESVGLGGDMLTLWEITFTADAEGTVNFVSDDTDSDGVFSTVVFDPGVALTASEIEFGFFALTIAEGDPPLADDDGYAVDEDQVLTVTAENGVLANDTSVSGEPLRAILLSDAANGTVALNDDGSFTYTPDANFFGQDTFTYTANDGQLSSNIAEVTIDIAPIVDDPVANDDDYETGEDIQLNVDAAAGVLSNDVEVDGGTLTVTLVQDVSNGTLELNADGSFKYTPAEDYVGPDSFTYIANNGVSDTAETTVNIDITERNDAAEAAADAYSGDEDTAIIVTAIDGVLANDTDEEGDTLSAVLVSNAANGNVVLEADGSFVYTPDADFNGEDSFTYVAHDGTSDSAETTVTLTVAAMPDAPTGVVDAYSVLQDEMLEVNAADGVLSNDFDVDGDSLTATLVSGPTNGTLSFNDDGSFTYTPDAEFIGMDSFTYMANDGGLDSSEVTVDLTVGLTAPSSLSGYVFADTNNDGIRDAVERALGGVTITLSGTDLFGEAVDAMTTVTDANGQYEFRDLLGGEYTITESQPEFMRNGMDTLGSLGGDNGDAMDNQLSVTLEADMDGKEYNFGELGLESQFISIRDFLSSTIPQAVDVAYDSTGNALWYSVQEGWDSVDTMTSSVDMSTLTALVSATNDDDQQFNMDVSLLDYTQVRVLGSTSAGSVIRIMGTAESVFGPQINSAEGEAVDMVLGGSASTAEVDTTDSNYSSAADEIFAVDTDLEF